MYSREEEEGGAEYASYHQGSGASSEEPHLTSGIYTTGTTLLEGPLLEGELHNASGDGCGDGGDCGGKWVGERKGKYNNGEKGGSRCAQYGGHFRGKVCVGAKVPANEGKRIFTEVICFPAKWLSGVCQEWIEPDEAR